MFNDVEIVATTEEAEIPEIEIPEVLEYEDEEVGDKIEGSGARRARFQALNKEMKQKEKQRRRKKARRQQARAQAKSDENLWNHRKYKIQSCEVFEDNLKPHKTSKIIPVHKPILYQGWIFDKKWSSNCFYILYNFNLPTTRAVSFI